MILSISRRTDVPAFYFEWFFNRLTEGYVYIRNPINQKLISKVNLNRHDIDFMVFWTKNPSCMLDRIGELNSYGIPYYFQVTVTAYEKDIENNVDDKNSIVHSFKKLSNLIGSEKVIWRYDPILITDKYSCSYHIDNFEKLMKELHPYTKKCIISFIDLYKKCTSNMKHIIIKEIDNVHKMKLAKELLDIANKYNIELLSCAEDIGLESIGIKHGKCIDDALISKILKSEIRANKDKNQRSACGCVESIDIGEYNTCMHHCLYCYANCNFDAVRKNHNRHDTNSPLLIGVPRSDDIIKIRKVKSILLQQDGFKF